MTLTIASVHTLYATYYTLLFTITNSGSSPGVNWLYHFNAPSGHTLASFSSCYVTNQGNNKYMVVGDGSTYSVPGSGGTVNFTIVFDAPSGYSSIAPKNPFLDAAPFGSPQLLNVNATNVVSSGDFNIDWNPLQGSEVYLIQIANNTGFTSEFSSYLTSGITYYFSSLSPDTYFFQLLGGNRYGQSGWSSPLKVVVASGDIDVPTLSLGSIVGDSVTIDWTTVTGASGYQLVQASDAGFTTNVVIDNLPSTDSSVTLTLASGNYYFEIATQEGTTQSFYSASLYVSV